ncbi:tetratricopeptide repeat protein [Sphingopyxis sp.]|uniref:tetratricopeptide repeat protein n=1 Tax=Sphingopyxis sp. TaxID=1908224 RepID=UPI0025D3E215|nr:tetratricopeptide repeat protein [Sphingopyxis sp.]MBK6412849.1 tetratricopeptide repeat protein [Sphingopyxis sp.]
MNPLSWAMRAHIFDKLGRNEQARAIFEELTSSNGDNPSYWVALGHGHRSAGDVDAAIAAYRRAVEIDYAFGDGWWSLASIKSRVLTDRDIAAMERGIKVAIDVRNSAPLHFALARALHDRGDYRQAFDHYERREPPAGAGDRI